MSSSARAAIATLLVAGSASAVEVAAPGARTEISPPRDDLPPAVEQRTNSEAPTLRCWQEGRLVIERAGVDLAEQPQGAYVFRRKDSRGRPVVLFDMRHGLCVLSYEAVAPESLR
jgi:hypothetical protein